MRRYSSYRKRLFAALRLVLAYSLTQQEALDLLEVDEDAIGDDEVLKRAYHKAALKHHPDKGGDTETMKKVNIAYDMLLKGKKEISYESTRDTEYSTKDVSSSISKIIRELNDTGEISSGMQTFFKWVFGKAPEKCLFTFDEDTSFLGFFHHKSLQDFADYWNLETLKDALEDYDTMESKELTYTDSEDFSDTLSFFIDDRFDAGLLNTVCNDILKRGLGSGGLKRFWDTGAIDGYFMEDTDTSLEGITDWESFESKFKKSATSILAEYLFFEKDDYYETFVSALQKGNQFAYKRSMLLDIQHTLDDCEYTAAQGDDVWVGVYLDKLKDVADLLKKRSRSNIKRYLSSKLVAAFDKDFWTDSDLIDYDVALKEFKKLWHS